MEARSTLRLFVCVFSVLCLPYSLQACLVQVALGSVGGVEKRFIHHGPSRIICS